MYFYLIYNFIGSWGKACCRKCGDGDAGANPHKDGIWGEEQVSWSGGLVGSEWNLQCELHVGGYISNPLWRDNRLGAVLGAEGGENYYCQTRPKGAGRYILYKVCEMLFVVVN